jgi:hypothetical protein
LRSTRELLDDHMECRRALDLESDLRRNNAHEVV